MPATAMKGKVPMKTKKVTISSKRQITIPQKFFSELGFDTEAECIVRGNELILRPIKSNMDSGDFSDLILSELIAEGYSGNELLVAFREKQKEVRPAIERMMAEAKKVAEAKAEYCTFDDIFNTEE